MPATDPESDQRWFPVAQLLRPQGRRGEILADPLTDLPEIFAKGVTLHCGAGMPSAHLATPLVLEDCWRPQGRNAGRIVLKFAAIDCITAAEALNGKQLFVLETALPPLEADTFLVRDLLGCSLFDGNTLLGTIVDLQFPVAPDGRTRLPDAADLLVIEPSTAADPAETVLVPFVKAWLDITDLPNKRLVMHLPPGLFAALSQAEDLA